MGIGPNNVGANDHVDILETRNSCCGYARALIRDLHARSMRFADSSTPVHTLYMQAQILNY